MTVPELSVVMSVYNGASRLADTLESIASQTYCDYEFIIINDGSTDNSLEIINAFASGDARVRVFSHENMGLAGSLNRGIQEARGRLIARQDAGDVSHPTRLERQMEYLAANPQLQILGTQFNYVVNGSIAETTRFPCSYDDIRKTMPHSCCILHGTAIFNKDAFWDVGAYRPEYQCAQDYELWIRFTKKYAAENLRDILYDYHIETTSTTFSRLVDQVYFAHFARWSHYYYQLGPEVIAKEMHETKRKIAAGYLYWAGVVIKNDKMLAAALIEKVLETFSNKDTIVGRLLLKTSMIERAHKYCNNVVSS